MQSTDKEAGEMEAGAAAFVQSELFSRTFHDGMTLVEETANYLDGEGRKASRALPRAVALSYAGASMRLTTQLMQIASWLLVLRAVREGDMTAANASDPKYRIKPNKEDLAFKRLDGLPTALGDLIARTETLFSRIGRLDATLFAQDSAPIESSDAIAQQRALFEAFGR